VNIKDEARCSIVSVERLFQGLVHVCRGTGSRNTNRPCDCRESWDEVSWLQEAKCVTLDCLCSDDRFVML
jgi:hypothetical protein